MLRLIAGEAWRERSAVPVHSPLFYLEARPGEGARLLLPDDYQDRGAEVTARSPTLLMLPGGARLAGERQIWWNFVAGSEARIERAKADWRAHPFPAVPGGDERIPLPEESGRCAVLCWDAPAAAWADGRRAMDVLQIDWGSVLGNLGSLGAALVLALPVALNRERHSRAAGLRTFPLVAVATCGFTLIGLQVLDSTEAEARVLEGVMTGIGFIGGGAILKDGGGVHGTATAASIWNTAGIGVAVAYNRFEIALLLTLVNFLVLQLFPPIKDVVTDGAKGEPD